MRAILCRTVFAHTLAWPFLLLVAGCGRPAASANPGEQAAAPGASGPTAVTAVKPVRQTLVRKIEQPGEIQAFAQTPMYAYIAGFVLKVSKDIGDGVEKDEVLVELSVPEREEELSQKKALVDQAEAKVEQARKLFEAAEANVQSAVARVKEAEASRLRVAAERRRAESQYQRLRGSAAVISRESVEEALLGAEAARAAVSEVEAKVKSAEAAQAESAAQRARAQADIAVAKANLRVAQAEERNVAALLGYARLRAPFKGVVTRRNVDPGHLLQPATAGAKGEPVFVVAQMDPVRIFVDVPEDDAGLVTDDTPATVRVQALKGETFEGKVRRSAWALDPKSRTLRTEIDLPNPTGRLRPGMYAYATISVKRANALAVPASAVLTQGEQTFCFLVQSGKAVRTPVQVGFRDAQAVEVLKKRKPGKEEAWEDFTGQEEVVGQPAGLADGQAVTVSSAPERKGG